MLLASSWCASYFTLRLIDSVVVQNKLSVIEVQQSREVAEALGISQNILLKEADISYQLSLGYAAPFIITHNDDYYAVVEKPVNVEISNSLLKLVKVADSEKDDVALIVSNMFQTYVHSATSLDLSKFIADKGLDLPAYSNSNYSNVLSVAVPPPRI